METDSRIKRLGVRMPRYADHEVRAEPSLRDCDMGHAKKLGGRLMRDFLDLLPFDWLDVPLVIDSRLHWLNRGWRPCVPGWHQDDVEHGREQHIMALVNADVCSTEFAIGKVVVPPLRGPYRTYQRYPGLIESKLAKHEMLSYRLKDGELIAFNDRTFHQCTEATEQGWRWFVRASRYYDKMDKVASRPGRRTNEVVKQMQVYMENEDANTVRPPKG